MFYQGVMVHAYKPSTWEAQEGGLLQVQGQSGLNNRPNIKRAIVYIKINKGHVIVFVVS